MQSGVFIPQADQVRFPGRGHLTLDIAQPGFHLQQRSVDRHHFIQYRAAFLRLIALLEIPHHHALLHGNGAFIGTQLAAEDAQQGCLAASVHANQTHPLPLGKRQVDILKHFFNAKGFLQVGDGQYDQAVSLKKG